MNKFTDDIEDLNEFLPSSYSNDNYAIPMDDSYAHRFFNQHITSMIQMNPILDYTIVYSSKGDRYFLVARNNITNDCLWVLGENNAETIVINCSLLSGYEFYMLLIDDEFREKCRVDEKRPIRFHRSEKKPEPSGEPSQAITENSK